jgi:hypothetical protein
VWFYKGWNMRAIERDYLAAFADRVSLAEWGAICDKAIELAKDGDAKARQWVTGIVLGRDPLQLAELARRESIGLAPSAEIAGAIEFEHTNWMQRPQGVETPLQMAEVRRMQAIESERAAAELATRRQQRAARKAQGAGASDQNAPGAEI